MLVSQLVIVVIIIIISLKFLDQELICRLSADLSVDALDVSGEQHIDVEHNIFKQRLYVTGDVIPISPEKESQFLIHILNLLVYFL